MVMRTTRRRRARGLTLIEVMIALLVTTIALLGALATVGITIRGANFARTATEASVLAQSKLEQLVSLPQGTQGGSLPTGTGLVGIETPIDANGSCTNTLPCIYTRKTTWTTSLDGIRRTCTVEVDWADPVNPSVTHSVFASRQQALQ
jgi:Tfp pilus assembly protein PilV